MCFVLDWRQPFTMTRCRCAAEVVVLVSELRSHTHDSPRSDPPPIGSREAQDAK